MTAWSPWHRKDMDVLEKIQHRATRRMSDVRGTYPERLEQLGLTTLEKRRARGDAIEAFKYLKGFLDVDKETVFKPNASVEPKTRQQRSYVPLNVQTSIYETIFSCRAARLWNTLPSKLRECSTVNSFKNAYDALMTQK